MKKNNENTAAARDAALDDLRELAADNAAAALEDAIRNLPPVTALGKDGKENIYFARHDGSLHALKPNEHSKNYFLRMADFDTWARWIAPHLSPDAAKASEKSIWQDVAERLFSMTLGKNYFHDKEHRIGIWRVADGWIYCSGRYCYFRPAGDADAVAVLVDNVHNGHVFIDKQDFPAPAADALTDGEGELIIQLFAARTWELAAYGELMIGWQVAALLAGALPVRPHVWVNAPAGSGKSTLFADLKAVAGGFCFAVAGGASTSAGIRQSSSCTALPVILDEAEAGDNEKARKNIGEWLELMRLASYGQKMVMGGKDGKTAKEYPLTNCFALASVGNTLSRAADTSRCLKLELAPYQNNEERKRLWSEQDAGRALTQCPDYFPRLMARLLHVLPVLTENIRTLTRHLRALDGVDVRRGELFAVLMSCRYALTSSAPLTPEQIQHAADVVQEYAAGAEDENDSERCLEVLLSYKLRIHEAGEKTVRAACRVLHGFIGTHEEQQILGAHATALETIGMRWREEKQALEVDTRHPGMRDVFRGSIWQTETDPGRVIAEGAIQRKGQQGANARGIWFDNVKKAGKVRRMVFIPAALIL